MQRREFLRLLAIAGLASGPAGCAVRSRGGQPDIYAAPPFGQARLIHFTDCHAQLLPVHFREPNVNLGFGNALNRPPHLVGHALLDHADIAAGTAFAYAVSHLDFAEAARRYGKVGGFAHLVTLVNRLRDEAGPGNSLLLDGGDTWQGSGTAYWTRGRDMVGACNLLGVDVMTGHWEFTYLDSEVLQNIAEFAGEFVAQNVRLTDDAIFEGAPAFDEDTGHVFRPYTLRDVGGRSIAIIGQAFPYTPIANPSRFIPNWTFGIRAGELQDLVNQIRERDRPDAIVLLSHNGMDVDIKLAGVVSGLDAILGGHTHDGMPLPMLVDNDLGKTIVTNAGSNGKFLSVLDLEFGNDGVRDFRYRLLPVFANLLTPDAEMEAYIAGVRAPHLATLDEPLATADQLLYRRGNFNGTFDQIICDAQREVGDAQIALSPGFRWGTSVLPGDTVTMERVMEQTCITYPETYVQEMTGEQIKLILEDVCDNLFNPDPFYQQGGDMVRTGGLDYVCAPLAASGQRISDMTLNDGTRIEASRRYRVAGWARVGSQAPGAPIWEVVAEYLRDTGIARIDKLNTPVLKGIGDNLGLADYPFVN
ncbi:MAG: thiosulfohydrolase SoxB [Gammaproteobacteria bacterium]|nr:thiosulfohydrolase SoxB [Gammaproteobacteria bacterium]MDH3431579.1 thiosulfohydrolase SoxB [Gammaproteobacteria bacterium]